MKAPVTVWFVRLCVAWERVDSSDCCGSSRAERYVASLLAAKAAEPETVEGIGPSGTDLGKPLGTLGYLHQRSPQ